VYNILQRKEEYKCDFQTNSNKGVKRKLQDDSGRKIDKAVFSWFVRQIKNKLSYKEKLRGLEYNTDNLKDK
jgi:hypothetical protein